MRMGAFDRLTDPIFDAILWLVGRLSDRSVFILAYGIYFGIGLALPLALSWSWSWVITANLLATTIAFLLALMWFTQMVRAAHARHLIEWTTDLRLLDSAEFEWFVGELYRRDGWSVAETGQRERPDGNIDLELRQEGQRRIVQCKRWTSWLVGVDDIREFAGTLMREGLPGSAGIFVTSSDFSTQARAEAGSLGIELVDREALFARVQQARRREPCPRCGEGMVLDRSSRGWWLRCVATGCPGKRDLGGDPVRALELLVEPPAPTK